MSPSLVTLDAAPALALFVDVVETGSFARAGRKAGVTTSSVSKRIAQLERRLGVRLLHRTTRRVAPTDAGARLHAHAARLLHGLAAAEHELLELGTSPRGVLRVATSVSFGQLHLGALAAEFAVAHPAVRVELSLDEAFVDLVAGGFDVAIRCGRKPDSSLRTRRLARATRVACASPAYLARHGTPAHPRELAAHACLCHGLDEGGGTWTFAGGPRPLHVRVRGPVHANNALVLREAAASGAGIALLPSFIVNDYVRDGRLRTVLDAFTIEYGGVYAVYPPSGPPGAQPSRLVRAFVDHLVARLPAQLAAR